MSLDLRQVAPNLEFNAGGWWEPPAVADVSYPESGHSLCFAVEDRSFWFQHRNRCILALLDRFAPPGALLDIGGGNGCVARAVQESGREVVLVEPGMAAARNALKRGVTHVVRASLEDAGFCAGSVPAAGLFDVLEHVAAAGSFLRLIHRALAPGARLYLSVPAFGWLWSHEDVFAGHQRRYTLSSLRRHLEAAGFSLEYATYFFGFLPPAVFISRALPFRLGMTVKMPDRETVMSDHTPRHQWVSAILDTLARRELAKVSGLRSIAWGSSCLAVARKR